MRSAEDERKSAFKKAIKTLSLVGAAGGIAIVLNGCNDVPTTNLKFPNCRTDPQVKLKTVYISNQRAFGSDQSTHISISGVGFKLSRESPEEVNLDGDGNRVSVIKENERYELNDGENGREYDIFIGSPSRNQVGKGYVRSFSITATCKS